MEKNCKPHSERKTRRESDVATFHHVPTIWRHAMVRGSFGAVQYHHCFVYVNIYL